MSLQDDIFDVRAHCELNEDRLAAFDRIMERFNDLEETETVFNAITESLKHVNWIAQYIMGISKPKGKDDGVKCQG